ncbi:unnamed protein product [Prorocentrum cordatum]|uniref:Uncharacterized protein n=1 Tax=Prorocentrum cordatum TaxID=2364126 RepID=A0ABN9TUM1_9DINO|nr:unnamed protein product [Polarella glacialis]
MPSDPAESAPECEGHGRAEGALECAARAACGGAGSDELPQGAGEGGGSDPDDEPGPSRGADLDPAEVAASLGSVSASLQEQISAISEEMDRMRSELYGEAGLGGIAAELERLKAAGMGDLMGGVGDGGADARHGASSQARGGSALRQRRRVGDGEGSEYEDLRRRVAERTASAGQRRTEPGAVQITRGFSLVLGTAADCC